MGNEHNISYALTRCGRKKAEDYIRELEAKRKEIMDAGKDTCDSTNIPTVEDIQDDIAFTGVNWDDPDGPCYYNGWGVTDNYESDYPLLLKLGRDFAESGYIPSDTDTIMCPEQYSAGGHKDMIPGTTVIEYDTGHLWKVASNDGVTVILEGFDGISMGSFYTEDCSRTFSLLTPVRDSSGNIVRESETADGSNAPDDDGALKYRIFCDFVEAERILDEADIDYDYDDDDRMMVNQEGLNAIEKSCIDYDEV